MNKDRELVKLNNVFSLLDNNNLFLVTVIIYFLLDWGQEN